VSIVRESGVCLVIIALAGDAASGRSPVICYLATGNPAPRVSFGVRVDPREPERVIATVNRGDLPPLSVGAVTLSTRIYALPLNGEPVRGRTVTSCLLCPAGAPWVDPERTAPTCYVAVPLARNGDPLGTSDLFCVLG
jgi:hypothetical protein